MRTKLLLVGLCLSVASPVLAVKVDRETVEIVSIQLPTVNAAELDYGSLRAEIARGGIRIGEPRLATTKSWCVPEHSRNKLKDAIELETYYYKIPYDAESGVLVVRDATGRTVYAERLEALESSQRFGYDQCAHWVESNLEKAYPDHRRAVEREIENEVDAYFDRLARGAMDRALFFAVIEEKVPLYRFRDKEHDYAELDRAFELAKPALAAVPVGEAELREAIEIWQQALEESELNDKDARINRKVSVRLYQNVGISQLVLGDTAAAKANLEKARRFSSMTTSSTRGTGTADLLQRVAERRSLDRRNPDLPNDPDELEALRAEIETYRGRVPLHALPETEVARLSEEHAAFTIRHAVVEHVAESEEQQRAVEAGAANPYEPQVGRTATQGFYLFVMPYGNRLDEFPEAVTELTYLNQLRMPKHGFDTVPDSIGNLTELKVLDLSGNKIERFPEAIGNLTNLKTLKVKNNPLAPGELERLQSLLPKCKIKG